MSGVPKPHSVQDDIEAVRWALKGYQQPLALEALARLEEQYEVMEENLKAYQRTILELKEQLEAAETTLAHAEAFIKHQDMSYRWAEWCEGRDLIPAKIGHGRLTEPAEQAQGSGDARSHPASIREGSVVCQECGAVIAWEEEFPGDCLRCGASFPASRPVE